MRNTLAGWCRRGWAGAGSPAWGPEMHLQLRATGLGLVLALLLARRAPSQTLGLSVLVLVLVATWGSSPQSRTRVLELT